jgi:hypothetical protein
MAADVEKTHTEGVRNISTAMMQAAKAGQTFAEVQTDLAQSQMGAAPLPARAPQGPSGPVQQAPQVRPQADQQSLPLPFAKGLAPPPVPPGGYSAGLGLH